MLLADILPEDLGLIKGAGEHARALAKEEEKQRKRRRYKNQRHAVLKQRPLQALFPPPGALYHVHLGRPVPQGICFPGYMVQLGFPARTSYVSYPVAASSNGSITATRVTPMRAPSACDEPHGPDEQETEEDVQVIDLDAQLGIYDSDFFDNFEDDYEGLS